MVKQLIVCVAVLSSWVGTAQTVLRPEDRARFNLIFDQITGEPLKCDAQAVRAALNFNMRFELNYAVECDIRQFEGKSGTLTALLRVRPEDGKELLMWDRRDFPAAQKDLTADQLRRTHNKLGVHGALNSGAGIYFLDLLLVDNRMRVYRHHWTAKALPRGSENQLTLSMPPNTVAPVTGEPAVAPQLPAETRRSVTVIVNAAPLNPGSLKLRRWDRAFLLDTLSSLLRQLPNSSVRLVAFNLEQEREIYRTDNFQANDLRALATALRALDLGAISYNKLEHKRGWAEFLLDLLKAETQAEHPSNAIVFLGPKLRLEEKAPPDLVAAYKLEEMPRVFCVAYYPRAGADFPDSVQQLTTALKGRVFKIHSPSELARNLEKLKKEIAD